MENVIPKTNTMKGVIAFAEKTNGSYGYWTDDTSNHNLLSKYGTNYPVNVFDSNSLLYEPVQKYKTYLKNTLGKTSVETKLITYEDLISLGCDGDGGPGLSCNSAPSWVYSTNYWNASGYNNRRVWSVTSTVYVGRDYFDNSGLYGLRPVITISKSDI